MDLKEELDRDTKAAKEAEKIPICQPTKVQILADGFNMYKGIGHCRHGFRFPEQFCDHNNVTDHKCVLQYEDDDHYAQLLENGGDVLKATNDIINDPESEYCMCGGGDLVFQAEANGGNINDTCFCHRCRCVKKDRYSLAPQVARIFNDEAKLCHECPFVLRFNDPSKFKPFSCGGCNKSFRCYADVERDRTKRYSKSQEASYRKKHYGKRPHKPPLLHLDGNQWHNDMLHHLSNHVNMVLNQTVWKYATNAKQTTALLEVLKSKGKYHISVSEIADKRKRNLFPGRRPRSLCNTMSTFKLS